MHDTPATFHKHTSTALIAVALAFIPGQALASSLRWWFVAGLLPLVWVWHGRKENPSGVWSDGFARVWGGVGVWAMASALWVPSPGAALWVGVMWVGLACALAAGRFVAQENAHDMRALTQGAMWAGVVAALPTLTPWAGVDGTFGNPNHLGALLSLTLLWTLLPSSVGAKHILPEFLINMLVDRRVRMAEAAHLSHPDPDTIRAAIAPPDANTHPPQTSERALSWVLRGAAAVVQLVALYRTDSLGAWAALGLGLAAAGVVALRRRWGVVGAWSVIAVGAFGFYKLLEIPEIHAHLRSRLYMARVALNIVKDHPLVGAGAGQMPAAWMDAQAAWFSDPLHDTTRDLWTLVHHVHNEALQAAGELGIIAALALMAPVLVALTRRVQPAAPWACVVAMGVLACVTLPLYEPTTALLFALALGVALGPRPLARTSNPKWFVLMLGLVLSGTILMGVHALSDRLLASGTQNASPGTLELSASLSLKPATSLRYAAAAIADSDPIKATALAKDAALREPSPRAWAFVGELATQAADLDTALSAYLQAVTLHPWYFTGHFNLAITARDLGNLSLSRHHADIARKLRPRDPLIGTLP